MTHSLANGDDFIYEEMMVHPLFFTHPKLKNIALIGRENSGLLREMLKHQTINSIWQAKHLSEHEADPRLNFFSESLTDWLQIMPKGALDAVIIEDLSPTQNFSPTIYEQFYNTLNADGIFLQQSHSLFNTQEIKTVYQALRDAGFQDLQILHFPQPSYPSGSRTALMAVKYGTFKRIREKDIFNKTFATRFYNLDTHKAALAMPEFVREELA
jgi:spermidine synthase